MTEETQQGKLINKYQAMLGKLGLPENFLFDLVRKEDDWSFIIKTHALLEGSITHLLVEKIGQEYKEVFSHLELGDKKKGKLSFAKAKEMLSKESTHFVHAMAEVRNELIHNLENVNFSFNDPHAGDLKKKIENLYKGTAKHLRSKIEYEGKTITAKEYVAINPKFSVMVAAGSILDAVYNETKLNKAALPTRLNEAWAREMIKRSTKRFAEEKKNPAGKKTDS